MLPTRDEQREFSRKLWGDPPAARLIEAVNIALEQGHLSGEYFRRCLRRLREFLESEPARELWARLIQDGKEGKPSGCWPLLRMLRDLVFVYWEELIDMLAERDRARRDRTDGADRGILDRPRFRGER